MIKREWMSARTRAVFDALAGEAALANFVLIGGTALSVQIGHRLSEDLDFWLPAERMSKSVVDGVLAHLASNGHACALATPAWQITQARINGTDLLSQSRDHVVDGVKVTFFAKDDIPYRYFSSMARIGEAGVAFPVMHRDGIFAMKSWLISQRVKSRDLFDLMALVRDDGKTVEDILLAGAAADPAYSREYAKEVLVGNVPLDSDDEGLAAVGLDVTAQAIHAFFLERVNAWETRLAASIAGAMARKGTP